ncbi:MAG: hypothetical protein AMJ84_05930 [Acidithiobacillales bacterium SM23_46]|nr:MAG: hypothetical protein AMJ84_05930 [Acidithiobacillales bacterium SM23_46]
MKEIVIISGKGGTGKTSPVAAFPALAEGKVLADCDMGDARVRNYCLDQGIEVLAEIPDDRRVAEAYSRGELVAERFPTYGETMAALCARVAEYVHAGGRKMRTASGERTRIAPWV